MKKFEYKVIKIDAMKWTTWMNVEYTGSSEIENELAILGEDGWELVNSFDTNHGHGHSKDLIFIFKKEKLNY